MAKYSSLLHSVQTGFGAHSVSCPKGTGALLPGLKWPGRKTDYSPLSSVDVRNGAEIILLSDKSSLCGD